MIRGLNVGYSYTKDHTGNIFRSAYTKDNGSVLSGKKITIDNEMYFVGIGTHTSDTNKVDSVINKVCTLYDLTLGNIDEPVSLVVCLPIAQFKDQKEKLVETILNYNKSAVLTGGVQKHPKIERVLVTMEGVAALYTLEELRGQYIVIDIGGLTVDLSLTEFAPGYSSLLKFGTIYKGVRTLYGEFIDMINNEFGLKLDSSYAEEIMRRGELVVDEEKKDLSFAKEFLDRYVDYIVEEVKLKYPYKTVPIYLVGGGSILMRSAIAKRLNIRVINNPQFANAIGNYNIGRIKLRR